MTIKDIQALTFDTGGTILDWHSGFSLALSTLGDRLGVEKDWGELANEIRRLSLGKMLNLGADGPPEYNFDDAHRMALDEVLEANGMAAAGPEDRRRIWWDTVHSLQCWPDFPEVLPRLRKSYLTVSFTILSFRIIIDTAKRNGLSWDAVISCEAIGKYKMLPEAYRTAAAYLQLDPGQCCMVACHNFDLDAARAVGFKTAFVRRPDEWGPGGPPDPDPNPDCDFIVDSFPELAEQLGVG